MGAFNDFLAVQLGSVAGPVPFSGTLFGTNETVPVVIAQAIRGGFMALDSIDSLVDMPYQLLQANMEVVVRQYEIAEGVTHPRTRYYLKQMPPANTRVGEIADYVFSDYWGKASESTAATEGEMDVQFAPNYDGKRPRFLSSEISQAAYNAGYPTTELYDGANPSDIIWVDEFDPNLAHVWMRQKLSTATNWGIPVSIGAIDYEANQYVDTIFMWVTPKGSAPPDRPIQPVDFSQYPEGWENTPGPNYAVDIVTKDLYRSDMIKNAFGVPKSPWSLPILVSADPLLTRYGNTPGNTEFLNDTYWRGYYTPGLDTYMATRPDALSSDWTIRKIDNESGEYTEFAFKLFPLAISVEDLAAAIPTRPHPYGGDAPNDCLDAAPASTETHIVYMTSALKNVDGSFKNNGWSMWRRFDGMDNIQVVIEDSPGDTFFRSRNSEGNLVLDFNAIVLTAKMYKANAELTSGFTSVSWYRGATLIVFDSTTRKATNLGVSFNQYHEVSVDGKSLTVNPEGFDSSQEYSVRVVHTSREAYYTDKIILKDTTDDGNAFVVDIKAVNGSTFKNQSGLYKFDANFFKGGELDNEGVTFLWTLKDAAGTPITNALRDEEGDPIAGSVTTETVYVSGEDIDQYAQLELVATFGEIERTDVTTLTDVEDGFGLEVLYWGIGSENPGNPTDFADRTLTKEEVLALDIGYLEADDAAGAWYMIQREGGVWGGEIQIRGENGAPAGGVFIYIFKNVDFSVDGAPAAPSVPGSGSIIPAGWSTSPTEFTGDQDRRYASTCLFLLRTDVVANPTVFTRDNYTPSGTYSAPYVAGYDTPPTETPSPGTNGWTPQIVSESYNGRKLLKVTGYFGGTGTEPSIVEDANYIGEEGLTTRDNATDFRGPAGSDAAVRPYYVYESGNEIGSASMGNTPDSETYRLGAMITNSYPAARNFVIHANVGFRKSGSGVVYATVRLRSRSGSWTPLTIFPSTISGGVTSGTLRAVNRQEIVNTEADRPQRVPVVAVISAPANYEGVVYLTIEVDKGGVGVQGVHDFGHIIVTAF
jgi:hypothetical protein